MSLSAFSAASQSLPSTSAGCGRGRSNCSQAPSAHATWCRHRATSTSRRGFRSSPVDHRCQAAVMRLALIVLLALALAPVANAGESIDRAASSLANDPVYIDPASTYHVDAAALRSEIESNGDGPIYIAVLSAAALAEGGGDATGVIDQLHTALGRRGVYAAVVGNHFRAESTDLSGGQAGKLATAAFNAHRSDGVQAVLLDFVDRVGAARGGDSSGGGGGGFSWWWLIVPAIIAFLILRSVRSRRRTAADFRVVKETAREDLTALADDVQDLEHKVEGNEPARHDYLAALDKYAAASAAFDRAGTPTELSPVAESLEDGRYLMASAEARLAGQEPPERRPACFFDPRHGPSVRDVEWAPPGGQPRSVPACAACATRIEDGQEPESREVLVGGRSTPYWAAGPAYGGGFRRFFPRPPVGGAPRGVRRGGAGRHPGHRGTVGGV